MDLMTLATSRIPEPEARRWTQDEFYRLAEDGWFEGQRVQLIEGEIIQMPPQKSEHAWTIRRCQLQMEAAFGPSHWVRVQMPLNVGRESDPEPDIAVTIEPAETYAKIHPTSAAIVIEVSDSSLDLDRRKKALYASAGIEEYWIVNLLNRTLEVHRSPDPASKRYRDEQILAQNQAIATVARPSVSIQVSELLP